jgi:cytochrome c oxidase assembly protein subunit 16
MYLRNLPKHHFLLFGLPFFGILLGGTYLLSFFTSLRYERHSERVTAMSEEEQLSILGNRRKVDIKEDFYVSRQLYRT